MGVRTEDDEGVGAVDGEGGRNTCDEKRVVPGASALRPRRESTLTGREGANGFGDDHVV